MTNFCGYCGARLDPATDICPNCDLKTVTVAPDAKKTGNKIKKVSTAVVAVVLSVITVTASLFLLCSHINSNKMSDNDKNQNDTVIDDTTNKKEPANYLTMSENNAVDIYMNNKDVWLQHSTYNHPHG